MMKYILTDQGLEYLAKSNTGRIMFHVTKVMGGSGYSDTPGILEDSEWLQQMQLDDIIQEEKETVIKCVLTNLEVTDAYTLRQIGVFCVDSETGKEILVIIGQDEAGDPIPAISEREVEYLYNIRMKIDNAENVTFSYGVNDFLRKDHFYKYMDGFRKVDIGPADKVIANNTILLIVEESEAEQQEFDAVAYNNIIISEEPPASGNIENWADTGGRILAGNLTAGAEPKSGDTFFVHIEE